MANEVNIGNLVVRIIGDAKQLEKELKAAGAGLQKFDKDAKQSMSNAEKASGGAEKAFKSLKTQILSLVTAYVTAGAAIRAFSNAINTVTALDNLSQTTGISIERLSQLRGISLQLGIDFQVLSQAASQFGARMTEALASSTSKGSQAIRALGVDVRDASGNIRQLDDLLPELADAFAQFADGSNKAALAAALFGEEAGPRLIPLLNRGRAGLEELRNRLGQTFTPDDRERARQYQGNLSQLQLSFERLARELVNLTAGPVGAFIRSLAEVLNIISRMPEQLTRSEYAEHAGLIANSRAEIERLSQSTTEWQALAERDSSIRRQAQIVIDRNTRGIAEQEEQIRRLQAAMESLARNTPGLGLDLADAAAGVVQRRPEAPAMDPFALEKAQIVYQQMLERLTSTRSIFDEINFSWQEHANVVAQAIAQIDRTQDQAHRRQAARYAFERQLQLRVQEQWMQTAATAAQTIQALWPKQKGAAIAAAIINTSVGVMRAFASMNPPMSFITAALIAAQGAAQIATISSTNSDGTGGSGAAPVAPAPAEGAPMGRSLSISGIDPSSIFSGGQVRGLIDMINEEVRNGATLISTGGLTS